MKFFCDFDREAIRGTAEEINALITAAIMDGCWEHIRGSDDYVILQQGVGYMPTRVALVVAPPPAWRRLLEIAEAMGCTGAEDGDT